MRLNQAITDFETYLKADSRSQHTIGSYLYDLRMFQGWLNDNPEVATIQPTTLYEFLASDIVLNRPDGQPRAKGSVNKIKTSLKAFFFWLEETKAIPVSPAAAIRIKYYQRAVPDILNEAEQKRLLKLLSSLKGKRAFRDWVIYTLLLNTGLRVQELVDLDIADIDLLERRLTITAKGDQESTRFLNSKTRQVLEQYLRWRKKIAVPSPALFLSSQKQRLCVRQVQRSFEQWLKTAGISKHLTIHSLRHTFASTLYEKSNNLLAVKQALGHRCIASTLVYTHINPEQLSRALESL